jgi:hypothetical protein
MEVIFLAKAVKKTRRQDKWDREHMAVLAAKVRLEDAQAFRAWCDGHGLTVNAALQRYIFDCIGKHPASNAPAVDTVGAG